MFDMKFNAHNTYQIALQSNRQIEGSKSKEFQLGPLLRLDAKSLAKSNGVHLEQSGA